MLGNDQIWRVAIPFVNTSKVVKLPNHRNSIHEELLSESLNPETKMRLEAQKFAEWTGSRSDCTEVSDGQFGHSPYRLLPRVLVDCLDSYLLSVFQVLGLFVEIGKERALF